MIERDCDNHDGICMAYTTITVSVVYDPSLIRSLFERK